MREPTSNSIDRVDVGIVVAMPLEAAAIVGRLREVISVRAGGCRVSLGRLGKVSVAIVACGIGGAAAVRGTRLIVAGHRPSRLVAAGLCGGLDPVLSRNTILFADRVGLAESAESSVDQSIGRAVEERFLPIEPIPTEWQKPPDEPSLRTTLVTSKTVIATVTAKKTLRDATAASAVDMESWWVADEGKRLGLPVHVLRVVCDTATETVPADVASLAVAGSAANIAGTAVRLIWKRPSAAIDMVELRERAHASADALALRLERMLS